jgi:hypothetical protein
MARLLTHKRVIIGAVALTLLVLAFSLRTWRPREVADLERAKQAGADVQAQSEKLARSLDRVAENIAEAEGLGEQSDLIESLTMKQRDSLVRVNRLLIRQTGSLAATLNLIDDLGLTAEALRAESAEQADLVAATVETLRSLRGVAGRARSSAQRLAERTRYAALLAEDSARAFSGGP